MSEFDDRTQELDEQEMLRYVINRAKIAEKARIAKKKEILEWRKKHLILSKLKDWFFKVGL